MKDFISVSVSSDHNYECGTNILGRAGEGDITRLKITIPEALASYDAYLDFEKPNEERVRTPRLESTDGVAYYDVAPYLLTEHGELKVQLILQSSNGEIWKSSIKRYSIQKSINAVDDIPDKEDFITEVQKLVDELSGEVAEIAEILSNDKDFVNTVIDNMHIGTYVNTVDGSKLSFFFGTQAEYEALEDTSNLFAIITDDTTEDEMLNDISDLKTKTATNTSDISDLKTKGAKNTSDISENSSNISTLSTKVTTNTSNIATNKSNISTNASNIATNKSNITKITNGTTTVGKASLLKPSSAISASISSGSGTFPSTLSKEATYIVKLVGSNHTGTGILYFDGSSEANDCSVGTYKVGLVTGGGGSIISVVSYSSSDTKFSGTIYFYKITDALS